MAFAERHDRVRFVDIDGDGVFELLDWGEGEQARLLDSSGKTLWKFPIANEEAIYDVAAGDLDGDGLPEFVTATDSGLNRIDRTGRKIWHKPASTSMELEIVDTNGDGIGELIEANDEPQVILRDATGEPLRNLMNLGDAYAFTLVKHENPARPPQLLVAGDERITLKSLDDEKVIHLPAPACVSYYVAFGTHIQFEADRKPTFAVMTTALEGESTLYLYDADQKLIFQETMIGHFATIAAVAKPGGGQRLLIGGDRTVWEYVPAK
jgi:hypothetical protein